jgi:predicted DNA-binding transcriptional regulator YafY
MVRTFGRLLRLLALLEGPQAWTGAEIAEKLGVTTRTVRNDVDRLRSLGFWVEAAPGAIGGYSLGPEGPLPPLFLEPAEAVAITAALRDAVGRPAKGLEEATLRAMLKVERRLKPDLLRKADKANRSLPRPRRLERSALGRRISALANACEQHQRVRFLYLTGGGALRQKSVYPHSLVHRDAAWHLVAWENAAREWIVFPVFRMRTVIRMPWRFRPQTLEDSELSTLLAHTLSRADSRPS